MEKERAVKLATQAFKTIMLIDDKIPDFHCMLGDFMMRDKAAEKIICGIIEWCLSADEEEQENE